MDKLILGWESYFHLFVCFAMWPFKSCVLCDSVPSLVLLLKSVGW